MKSASARDWIGGQSHLILPVVLASIALGGIGFAVAALVGTGADAATSQGVQTIRIKSTTPGSTVVHTVIKKIPHVIKGKVVTRDGKVITQDPTTFFSTQTIGTTRTSVRTQTNTTTRVNSVTGPTVTSPPVTVTSPPVTVTSPPVTVTPPPVTVTAPPVTVTVTTPPVT